MINKIIEKSKDKNIVVFAGGTLGHIKPALIMSNELYKKGYSVYFITDNNKFKNILIGKNYLEKVLFYDSPGLNRKNILKNIVLFFVLLKTFIRIKRVINKLSPLVCIGMGGSISTIGLLASSKYKRVIHEQNAVIGLGNKIIRKKCDLCLSGFPLDSFTCIGNPINSDMNIINKSNKDEILILSGSNGSKTINDFFIDNINDICNMLKKNITIITGNKYYNDNICKIKDFNSKYINGYKVEVIAFTDEINKYYEKAYMVISRGGAGALSEIFNYNLLSIIIPSPNVTNNHQYFNAKYYYDKGLIEMIQENDLTIENLSEAYNKVIKNENLMKQNIISNHNIYSRYIFLSMVEDIINNHNMWG